MRLRDAKARLWQYGHAQAMNEGITRDQWDQVNSKSNEFKRALVSFQEAMGGSYAGVFWDRYQMAPSYTGEWGPAAKDLFGVERCGCPDFPMDEKGNVMASGGSGSWPEGCDPEWPDDHVFKIYLDKSRMPSFLGSKDDPESACEVALYKCMESYWQAGLRMIRVDNRSEADSVMSFQPGRGWIGLAIVPGSFSCNMGQIWAKFDTRYNPSALIDQWARLFSHELGHNCGWGHWRGGIMNPSIISGIYDIDEWINDPSWPRVRTSFGGDKVVPWPGDEPEPPQPPPGGDEQLIFKGSVEAFGKTSGKFYGHYKIESVGPPV